MPATLEETRSSIPSSGLFDDVPPARSNSAAVAGLFDDIPTARGNVSGEKSRIPDNIFSDVPMASRPDLEPRFSPEISAEHERRRRGMSSASGEAPLTTVNKGVAKFGTAMHTTGRAIVGGLADLGSEITGQTLRDEEEARREFRERAAKDYGTATVTESSAQPSNISALMAGEELPAVSGMKVLPTPLRITGRASQGMLETLPQLAAITAAQSVGVPAPVAAGLIFGSTPQGFDTKQAAVAAAIPYVGKYSGEITGTIARKLGVSHETALQIFEKAGGVAGAAAYLGTIQTSEIVNLPPEQRKDATIEAIAQQIGLAALGGGGETRVKSPLEQRADSISRIAPLTAEALKGTERVSLAPPENRIQVESRASDIHLMERRAAIEDYVSRLDEIETSLRDKTASEKEALRQAELKRFEGRIASIRPPRVEVPETPAEPYETAVQEVRRNNAKTIAQIQKLFSNAQLTREQAREFRDLAWGKPGEATPETISEPAITERQIVETPPPTPLGEVSLLDADAVSKLTPTEFVDLLALNKTQATQGGYEIGRRIRTSQERSRIEEYEKQANEQSMAIVRQMETTPPGPELDALFNESQRANAKKQYFNEALRLHDAIGETAKKVGILPGELAGFFRETAETTTLDPGKVPVVEIPIEKLSLSKDIPNFKESADIETGVVPGEQLQGKYERLGTGAIIVWKRNNGELQVISGRHRLDLAKRTGEKTIPSQIVDERAGFTKAKAFAVDAASNILTGTGNVSDYARFFRHNKITEEAAAESGLLARSKGRNGFDIGRNTSEDTYSVWEAGKISDGQAAAIAKAAPKNADLQRVAIPAALRGQPPEVLANIVKVARLTTGSKPKQLDLLGRDDAAMIRMETAAKNAASEQQQISEQIRAVLGSAKRPELARKLGVNVDDPASVLQKVQELRGELARWENWPMHRDLVEKVLSEPKRFELAEPESLAEARARESQESEQAAVKAQRQQLAEKAAAPLTAKPIETTGDLLDPTSAENPLFASKTPSKVEPKTELKLETPGLDKVDSTLSKWIDDLGTSGQGKLFADPLFIQSIGKPALRGALIVIRSGYRAGKTIYAAIEEGIAWLKSQGHRFDENEARAWFTKNLQLDTEATRQPTSFPVQGENVEMRQSAARAAESKAIPESVRQTISNAPESFYQQQSLKEVKNLVAEMSDLELSSVPRDSDVYTAAKLEQSRRLFDAGKFDEGYQNFVELEREGTRLGQLISQFQLLKGANPVQVATIIDRALVKAGYDPLTKTQRDKVINLAQDGIVKNRELEAAKDTWVNRPTMENARRADEALTAVDKADVALQKVVHQFSPKTVPGVLKSILQGNLLTPISEVTNIFGNLSFLPFRGMSRTVAASLDMIDSYLRNRPREITVQPIRGGVEAFKGAVSGMKEIPGILKHGSGDVLKGEPHSGMHPLRAWANQFAKNPDLPTVGGKLPFSDRVRLVLEGTFGMPAEVMLRGLGAGDIPFRRAARARIISNELKLGKVPGEHWSMAHRFPELFLNKEALKRVESQTLEAVFQQKSNAVNSLNKLFRFGDSFGMGDWTDLAFSTVAPYRLTPWNIAGEILSYNPLVAAARTTFEAARGNSYQAKISAGKFVVGSILTAAGYWLYQKGLLAPSMDSRDEAQKARLLSGQIMPPNHINVSGLERALQGGDPTFRPGDTTIDSFRAGGLAGSIFYMVGNVGRDFEKEPEDTERLMQSLVRNSTIEQARYVLNQSFLAGVGGVLEAVRSGETDGFIKTIANTALAIPIPNTLGTLSRAERPYKVEVNGITDLVKTRLGFLGLDDAMTLRRGLWGEPILETPQDRNAIAYHLFDVSKSQNVTTDPVAIELYKLWRSTADTRVIPSLPEKELTIDKVTYSLTPEQRSRLAELVGKSRRFYAEAIILNLEWQGLSEESKIKVLQKCYDVGREIGKAEFVNEHNGKLTQKPKRAGFTAEEK